MNARDEAYANMKNLKFIDVIGWGQSGVVYKVYDEVYQREFALKSILEKNFNKNEIDCMMKVDDPNIIRLYNYEYFEGSVYLLMENCPTSLDKLLNHTSGFDKKTLAKFSSGVIKAVRACHRCSIAHLDIKPANFLIDQYERIRICDFGLSSNCDDCDICEAGHQFAPEIMNMKTHDPFKADIWAVGVTLFIMATGQLPWEGKDRETLVNNLLNMPPRLELISDNCFATIVKRCLSVDPSCRPTIDELIIESNPPPKSNTLCPVKRRRMNSLNYQSSRSCCQGKNVIVQPLLEKARLR